MMACIRYYTNYKRDDKETHNVSVTFNTRRDAEEVYTALRDIITDYGYVSVGDIYDLIGEYEGSYTDHKYGWTEMGDIMFMRTSNGEYGLRFITDPHFIPNNIYEKHRAESKSEPEISVDILVTINGKKYKLVPVDDDRA